MPSLALAVLMLRERPARLGPAVLAATVAAAAVNLHTFPLMAWYTLDGLVLIAVGYALVHSGVRSGSRWRVLAGLFLIGVATTTKQSFAPAVLIGLALAFQGRGRWVRRARVDVAVALAAAALAPACYVLAVSAAGGLSELVAQATTVDKQFLLAPLTYLASRRMELVVAAGVVAIAVAIVAESRGSTRSGQLAVVATVMASLAVVVLPLFVSRVLWYGSASGLGAVLVLPRRLRRAGGRPPAARRRGIHGPVGGVDGLAFAGRAIPKSGRRLPHAPDAHSTVGIDPPPHLSTLMVRAGVGLAAAAVLAVVLIAGQTRSTGTCLLPVDRRPHGGQPGPRGSGDGPDDGRLSRADQDVRREVSRLEGRDPARRAGAYSALGLHPALPIDWLWPPDYSRLRGHPER